jgi:hypothetical protein
MEFEYHTNPAMEFEYHTNPDYEKPDNHGSLVTHFSASMVSPSQLSLK